MKEQPRRFEFKVDDYTWTLLVNRRLETGTPFSELIKRAIRAQYGSAVPRIETREINATRS